MQWLKTKTIEQALADSDEPGRQLQRSLGAFDLMILGVAVAVGRRHFLGGRARRAALPGRP
jgi:APA family basic amino acid/polyamine antiporter